MGAMKAMIARLVIAVMLAVMLAVVLAVMLAVMLVGIGDAYAQTAPPDATRYSATVATEWFRVVLPAIQQTPGQSPPVAARTLAYLSLGLYESIIAGMPGQRSLTGQLSELD